MTEKKDLHPGIYNFKMNGVKRELNKCSIMLSSPKYIQLPRLLYGMTFEALDGKEMFESTISVLILQSYGPIKFRKYTSKDLFASVNTYPLDHTEWVEGQKAVSKNFHSIVRKDWTEKVSHEVW